MAFWDNLLRRPQPVAFFTPNVTHLGADEIQGMILGDLTPAQMWATQPHLRTVVSFLARNIAQLGLHSFVRDGEDRRRDRESPFARTMRRPNTDQTAYDLVFALVGDLALYDRAYWLTVPDVDSPSGWTFRRLPPTWVTPILRDVFGAKSYSILSPDGESVEVPADQVLSFAGYHPSNPRTGSPTVEALKGTLQEQIEASKYRSQVWKRGGRVSAVIQRPKDAPKWGPEAAERFREDWYAKYTGNGPGAGGTPILEDGMTLNRIDFNAQEQQFVEAAKLSFATVASAFHVNPTMVGILDNANFSNVREFRRMLYGDTLGPTLAQIEDRINTFLLPRMGMDNSAFYAEFNIAEKLQGSFEEQAAVLQTAIGAPYMTRNEGRAKQNLPAIEGGDELITPLNVLVGGQASPTDSGSQNVAPKSAEFWSRIAAIDEQTRNLNSRIGKAIDAAAKRPTKKATDGQRDRVADALATFFVRQGKSVLSAIGAGSEWWDADRWDGELTDDLMRVTKSLADTLGKAEAARLGYADDYNTEQTVAFLRAVAERRAKAINETTRTQVAAKMDDPDGDPAEVFDTATTTRAVGIAALVATAVAGFATREAAQQVASRQDVTPVKTWVVNSSNPRSAHASMNGETVGIDDAFSNGMQYPGDYGDADEVAGCQCSLDVSLA